MPPETIRQPRFGHRRAQGLRVLDHPLLVGLPLGLHGLGEGHRLGRDDVHQRAALDAREVHLVDGLGPLGAAQDDPAARAAQGLVGGGGDEVAVGDR